MGLLFISHVMYEHAEPWWNDIDRGNFLTRPRKLSGNPTRSNLVANRKGLGEGYEFSL
jgi:hypothetical protein